MPTVHTPLSEGRLPALGGALGSSGGQTLPRAGLIGYWKTYDTDKFIDRIGATTRTLYQLQYIASTGTLELTHASIVGTETVTKPTGTATVTVAVGKLTIGSGALWSFSLSNGSTYEFATPLTATTGVVFDTSGYGRHLLFTVADTAVTCVSSREKGSDFNNLFGWTLSDGSSEFINTNGTGLIPINKVIPALRDGSGCSAYLAGGTKAPADFTGRAKYPFTADSDWNNATMPDCDECRKATGWTYGVANWAYNADGTAKTVSKATLEENGAGLRFYFGTKGAVLYSTDQTTYDTRIIRVLKSSGTLMEPEFILDPETPLI